jgi:hypothetical protein
MTWLWESPWQIGVLGAVAAISCCFAGFMLSNLRVIYAGVIIILLTLGLLGIERMIVTDREQIDQLIKQGVTYVNNNQLTQCSQLFDPNQQTLFQKRLRQVQSQAAQVNECVLFNQQLELTANQANATVVCRVKISGRFPYEGPVKVAVSFQKINSRWYITDAEPIR